MAFKVFADANFLLDITLQRQPSYPSARKIMEYAIDGVLQLYTTPAVLHVTAYFTGKHFSTAQTRQIILTLLNDITIIDCDHKTAIIAVNSEFDDMEDALQYYTAWQDQLDYFLSADKKLKKKGLPQLPACTSLELKDLLEEM